MAAAFKLTSFAAICCCSSGGSLRKSVRSWLPLRWLGTTTDFCDSQSLVVTTLATYCCVQPASLAICCCVQSGWVSPHSHQCVHRWRHGIEMARLRKHFLYRLFPLLAWRVLLLSSPSPSPSRSVPMLHRWRRCLRSSASRSCLVRTAHAKQMFP